MACHTSTSHNQWILLYDTIFFLRCWSFSLYSQISPIQLRSNKKPVMFLFLGWTVISESYALIWLFVLTSGVNICCEIIPDPLIIMIWDNGGHLENRVQKSKSQKSNLQAGDMDNNCLYYEFVKNHTTYLSTFLLFLNTQKKVSKLKPSQIYLELFLFINTITSISEWNFNLTLSWLGIRKGAIWFCWNSAAKCVPTILEQLMVVHGAARAEGL
jgi:hypothetical protein